MAMAQLEKLSPAELNQQLHASVLKREAAKEEEFRKEREKREEELHLGFGGTEMCQAELRKIIDGDRRIYYRTEELNDKLYCHYKGWRQINGLEKWTGLKALYAECNAFSRMTGLENCRSLRSLFLQENCIRAIEGLENCPQLWSLNLSSNFIERIDGLKHLKELNTLILAKNKIGHGGMSDVMELKHMRLNSLDIQGNQIWDVDILPEVLWHMPELRVLYLKDNPCAKRIPNYRKGITCYVRDLRYLDDRPVFPEDRRAAEAFNRGGLEEERAERRRIREENNAKHDANMRAFQAMIDEAKSRRREQLAMRAEDKYTEDTDPVETNEQRMKKLSDRWKEENAEDLKDDAKENALRCLKKEKEDREKSGEADCAEDETAPPLVSREEQLQVEEEAANFKVDNRKLVYEDIWDEGPSSVAPPQRAAESESGVFLPWATGSGAVGMDAVGSSASAVERRVAELQKAPAAASSEPKPAWYNRYAEKVQETVPDQRRSPTTLLVEESISSPTDTSRQRSPTSAAAAVSACVADCPPPCEAATELQEMD